MFAGTQDRLEDVVEHGFLPSEDVDLRHHAGNDRKLLIGVTEMTAIGTHANLIKALALPVDDGIGANVL